MNDQEALEMLKKFDVMADVLPIAVKYDDDIGGFWVKYIGGDKIAMVGDAVPAAVIPLAVANVGEWVAVGVGN